MRSRRRKNLLWISLVTTLLILSVITVNIPISTSSPGTVLAAPIIVDETLTPGSTFHINITVADVTAMWGYDVMVSYDTTVLTATSYTSYNPFFIPWPSLINDTAGYAVVSYSMMFGEPVGFSTVDPAPIVRIDFTVDAEGSCLLDLRDQAVDLSDILGDPIAHDTIDGFFANVPLPLHDITVKEVTANTTGVPPDDPVMPGDTVEINVNVFNGGANTETFNVTTRYDDTYVENKTVTDLAPLAEETVSFSWNTTGVISGYYVVEAEAILAGDENPADNTGTFEDQVMIGLRDIVVIDVGVSPTNVTAGDSVYINATVENQGSFTETFNVTVKYIGITPIGEDPCSGEVGTLADVDLSPGANTTWDFVWDTTGVKNYTYNIMAEATEVLDEADTVNNRFQRLAAVNVTYLLGTPKVIGIDYSPKKPVEGETVTLKALSTDPDGYIVSWDWDFGDGNQTHGTSDTTTHIYTTKGTYFVTLIVTDNDSLTSSKFELQGGLTIYSLDILIVNVTSSATEVVAGESVLISVTVKNQGDLPELQTFNVTAYYDDDAIETQEVGLAGLTHRTLSFSWNTTTVSRGTYTIKAVASNLTRESQTDNNMLQSDDTVTVFAHDIAVTAVTFSPANIRVGDSVSINVTVENQGDFTETFNVTIYYDGNLIDTQTDVSLNVGDTQTLTFTWDTTGVDTGTYAISANASVVSGEVDTADNTYVGDAVTVKGPLGTDLVLYVAAGIVVAIAAAVAVYFLRVRRPKTK